MRNKILLILALVMFMLIPMMVCCAVAFADDGILVDPNTLPDWRVVWLPILAFLWSIYWLALRNKFSDIWHTSDNFWWKMRGSFIAVFTTLWPCLKEVWKGYSGIIINFFVQLFKNKMSIPAMYRAASARPRRL